MSESNKEEHAEDKARREFEQKEKAEVQRMMKSAMSYSAIGLEFGVAIVFGYFTGTWLDNHFETSPYLLILMLALSLGAVVKSIVMAARRYRQEHDG